MSVATKIKGKLYFLKFILKAMELTTAPADPNRP